MNYSRMWQTCYWWLSFLIVPRWRLSHCWVNTSMPLRNNPRWLEMLLSLWAECDITSFLVFVPPWISVFLMVLETCCIFNHVCTQNEQLSSRCWCEWGTCQVCLFPLSVLHAKLPNMLHLFTLVFLSFFANLHFGNRVEMVLMCVFWSQSDVCSYTVAQY